MAQEDEVAHEDEAPEDEASRTRLPSPDDKAPDQNGRGVPKAKASAQSGSQGRSNAREKSIARGQSGPSKDVAAEDKAALEDADPWKKQRLRPKLIGELNRGCDANGRLKPFGTHLTRDHAYWRLHGLT